MFAISVNANSLYCGLPFSKLLEFLLTSSGLPVNILWCDCTEFIQCAKLLLVLHTQLLLVFSAEQVSSWHLADGLSILDRSISLNYEQSCTNISERTAMLGGSQLPLFLQYCLYREPWQTKPPRPKRELNLVLFYMAHFILIENRLKASKTKY